MPTGSSLPGTRSIRKMLSPWTQLPGTRSSSRWQERHVFETARCRLDFDFRTADKKWQRTCSLVGVTFRVGGHSPSAGICYYPASVELRHGALGACPAHRQLSRGFGDPWAAGAPEQPGPALPWEQAGSGAGKRLWQSRERARRAGRRRRAAWCIQTQSCAL